VSSLFTIYSSKLFGDNEENKTAEKLGNFWY